ncbi:MAG: DUF6441 family protein [Pseudomonadota bacterium]|tara:strand:- start:2104 stop:2799 length:696 start_codon:yes stop_codon:yes gene_type:complete
MIELEIDQKEIDRQVDVMLTALLKAGTAAVTSQTRALEKDLEALTRQNVKGNLWRAWRSDVFPKAGRASYNPVGQITLNGKGRTTGAITYWTKPGLNTAKNGFWLAIPTKFAGVLGRTRNITPGEWERQHGVELKFVYQGNGKPALLMAEQVVFGANGKGVRVLTKRRKQNARYINRDGSPAQKVDVPIFTLIPFQRFANKFSIDPVIARREGLLVQDLHERLEKLPTFRG